MKNNSSEPSILHVSIYIYLDDIDPQDTLEVVTEVATKLHTATQIRTEEI